MRQMRFDFDFCGQFFFSIFFSSLGSKVDFRCERIDFFLDFFLDFLRKISIFFDFFLSFGPHPTPLMALASWTPAVAYVAQGLLTVKALQLRENPFCLPTSVSFTCVWFSSSGAAPKVPLEICPFILSVSETPANFYPFPFFSFSSWFSWLSLALGTT